MIAIYRRIATSLVIATLPVAALAADPRPCELLASAEVATVLGTAAGRGEPAGPEVDKATSATSWSCGWTAGQGYLGAAVIRFRSAADATNGVKEIVDASRAIPESVHLSVVAGPGEQAAWGGSKDGAVWVARKGDLIVSVVLAMGLKNPEAQREPLRKLLESALGKL